MFRHVNGRVRVGPFECEAHEFGVIEPDYAGLPADIIERRYDPDAPGGKPRHVLITADHRQTGGPVPWITGDAMLAKMGDYPRLLAAAFPPPPAPEVGSPLKPKAPPPGSSAETLRQALIDAGYFAP